MRIAGIDPERNFGGGEVQVIGLTRELLRAGHEAELLCDPDGELWRRASQAGIITRPLKISNSLDAAAGLRLRALLGRYDYDVVHFHTARAHALAPFAARQARALVVTRRMDYVPNRWFAPWLYNRAVDGVIAISEGVAQALVSAGVERQRIKVIPSGIDCDRFAPTDDVQKQQARVALGLLPNEIAIGTVGSLVARKGHRFLIEAMALIRSQMGTSAAAELSGRRLCCLIAGSGPLRDELAHQIVRSQLAGRARLLGELQDVAALLSALDIFVMPSINEGLGVAALEAAAAGLPVIASAVGGLPEIVNDGESGILVGPGDATMLARAIRQLSADDNSRRTMGKKGRERAIHNWSIQLMARRTLELYYACLDKNSQRH